MTWQIKAGDARAVLAGEAAGSVQTVCTSPPYFGQRDYKGGALEIGQEPTVDAYLASLLDVFRAVRRVLRPDGTCWVNLGDSFARSSMGGGTGKHSSLGGTHHAQRTGTQPFHKPVWDLGEKQLLMVPARFALAMQGDGWILRQAITWCKTAPMPESVQDRPTSATEMIYLFSQQPRYYFDAAAIAEPAVKGAAGSTFTEGKTGVNGAGRVSLLPREEATTRNSWNYWLLGPAPSSLPHYAMFPPEIPRRCILAGTSAYGACARCGAPWRRVVERETNWEARKAAGAYRGSLVNGQNAVHGAGVSHTLGTIQSVDRGWAPGCACAAGVVPCRVLDPFSGAGTTIQEAARLGRDGLGIELLPANVELSRRRIIADCPLFNAPQEAVS